MTEKQFNEAKEKIQRYFEEINNEISVAKTDINKIKNNFHEYFIEELQNPTFNCHYQELLTLEGRRRRSRCRPTRCRGIRRRVSGRMLHPCRRRRRWGRTPTVLRLSTTRG